MNPYAAPLAKDEPPVTENLVMKVGYGKLYRVCLVLFSLLIAVPQVFLFTKLHYWLPLLMSGFSSVLMIWIAFVGRRVAYFEVYDNHILMLSPLTRKLRWKRSIGHRGVYRWVANGEEFDRFKAWRQERGVM